AREAWARRMLEVTAKMDDRLASLRERVQADLAELTQAGAVVTADDLVHMAGALREERARLRAEFTEHLEVIAVIEPTVEESGRFAAAMTRVRIERLLPRGRLGGESMNLWAALTETGRRRGQADRPAEAVGAAEAMLREWAPWIAEKLDGRSEAVLDREIQGLEFQAARDRVAAANGSSVIGVDQARLASALRPFADALRGELTASVAVRDALLTLLEESSTYVDETYPGTDVSSIYREAALRRGFPTDMRPRWSQRALAAALQFDDLGDETRETLVAFEKGVSIELRALRADAIAKRVRRDPRFAREQIDARFGATERKIEYSPELWLGVNYEAFASIDDRTESQLSAILAPGQMETLPARQRPWGKDGKGKGAKAGGKGQPKRNGG
ncbi:MAG: hypothetical protein ACYS0D_00740, partial [Planctomycetota bacterium]